MGKVITYHFAVAATAKDPEAKSFQIRLELDDTTSLLINGMDISATEPDWCLLDFKKCQHCPLSSAQHKYCPVAKNLAHYLKYFNNELSHRPTTITVETKERNYVKTATMQDGAFGVFGLAMATSGCPHLEMYRPLARFHLPFASSTETMVRNLSFYLLQQYFKKQSGEIVEMDFSKLSMSLEAVNLVNKGMIDRIRSVASKGDTDKNAIVILDSFVSILSMELSDNFAELKSIVI